MAGIPVAAGNPESSRLAAQAGSSSHNHSASEADTAAGEGVQWILASTSQIEQRLMVSLG